MFNKAIIQKIFSAREENSERKNIKEDKHKIRSEFTRDRDRILYSRAFRRLSGKTQVFLSGKDDHIRNRLSHTLEVAQIARTIAKEIGLNEELTEAIALAHDIGHTPFGHVGERTLNYIMCDCDTIKDFNGCLDGKKGFKHNWQGVRVVTELENKSKDYNGLNLTNYTLWGILNHSSLIYKKCGCNYVDNNIKICTLRRSGKVCENDGFNLSFYNKYNDLLKGDESLTIEGLIVGVADEIAQRHHDVEDALEAKVISYDDLSNKILECYELFADKEKVLAIKELDSRVDMDIKKIMLSSFIVDVITYEVIKHIKSKLTSYIDLYCIDSSETFEIKKQNREFIDAVKTDIQFTGNLKENDNKFQKFIWNRILHSHKAQSMDGKGNFIIIQLFKAYITNPQQLPDKTIIKLFDNLDDGIIKKYHQTDKMNQLEIIGKLRDELGERHCQNDKSYKEALMRTICDYISGMTDKYAMEIHSELYENK